MSSSDIHEVFEYWQKQLGFEGRRLTQQRREKIQARLVDYSVDQLKRVIDYVKTDPWWRGQNERRTPYDDIINIFRNETRVDQFLHKIKNTPDKTLNVFKKDDFFDAQEF